MTSWDASSGGLGAETAAPSDSDLLRSHVDGDPRAFAELVRRHRDRLWAVALRTIGDREEAADAVQDALLAAHRNAARFRGDSAVTTWLHRIVVNACLDRIRRRQAHPTVPLPDGSRSDDRPTGVEPAAPLQDHDTALVVRAALAALPPDQRAAIVLVDVQGYPVAEAAEILGVAEGTIKSRCARGRARMALSLSHLRTGDSSAPAHPTRAAGPPRPKTADGDPIRPRLNPADGGTGPASIGSGHPTDALGHSGQPAGTSDPARSGGDRDASGRPTDGLDDSARPADGRPESTRPRSSAAHPTDAPGDSAQPISATESMPSTSDRDASAHPAEALDGSVGPGEGGGDSGLARDSGHAADGNRGGARSVPSGPAAASGSRPSARDRRDQR